MNVSSTSAHIALPFASAYAASKFALEGLSDALRVELRGSGVQVSLIVPGAVKTPIWQKAAAQISQNTNAAESYKKAWESAQRITEKAAQIGVAPALVVRAIHSAISDTHAKSRYVVGSSARVRLTLKRCLPTNLLDALAHNFISRGEKKHELKPFQRKIADRMCILTENGGSNGADRHHHQSGSEGPRAGAAGVFEEVSRSVAASRGFVLPDHSAVAAWLRAELTRITGAL